MNKVAPLLVFLLLSTGCGGGGSAPAQTTVPIISTGATGTQEVETDAPLETVPVADQLASLEGLGFQDFTSHSFDLLLRRSPERTVSVAAPDAPLALDDISPAYELDSLTLARGIRDQLEQRAPSGSEEALLYQVYSYYLDDLIESDQFRNFGYPASYFITSIPSQTLFFFTDIHPLQTADDARAYLARLRYVDSKLRQLRDKVQRNADAGIVMPRPFLDVSVSQHQRVADAVAESSPYYNRFQSDVSSIASLSSAEREELLIDARNIITTEVNPAYQAVIDQLEGLRSAAPAAIGVNQFPNGEAYYSYTLRHHTTSSLSAREIHQQGLVELDRVHEEMRQIFRDLGYPEANTINENLALAASDSGVVAAADVVSRYEEIVADAYDRLPDAFGVLPTTELVVIGGERGGFYVRPAVDGSRPGAFYAANTRSETVLQMKSLAYHEAVPGHHLQIALALEQAKSVVQQYVTFTGFVEGWALYAERLAWELGWYENDPLGNLGRLQFEALRATRMVVDTGIHDQGWSFEEAVSFFQEATGFSRGASEGNIARYSLWPGQSTAYMVGMLEILRYRDSRADDPDFDLRAFHDQLLGRGAVPLNLLEF